MQKLSSEFGGCGAFTRLASANTLKLVEKTKASRVSDRFPRQNMTVYDHLSSSLQANAAPAPDPMTLEVSSDEASQDFTWRADSLAGKPQSGRCRTKIRAMVGP